METTQQQIREMRQRLTQEDLLRQAAAEISAMDMEDFFAAQDDPALQPPPEVLARLRRQTQSRLARRRGRYRRARFAKQAAAVVCATVGLGAVGFTVTFLSVDAARTAINNFFLEQYDRFAVVRPGQTGEKSGAALPSDWDGPAYPMWVPERFEDVEVLSVHQSTILIYHQSSNSDSMSISIWVDTSIPYVDTEDMGIGENITIQDVNAQLYWKEEKEQHTLIFTKNNVSIRIRGDLTREEIIKIAENISF